MLRFFLYTDSALVAGNHVAERENRLVDMVGGYRLVRKLGSGERGEVFLGYAGSEPVAEASTVAVKVFRTSVSRQSIGDEIGVLAGTSSPHLLRLLDVATTPDGRPCAIVPRLSSVSLARLLMDRTAIGVGESITILAPLCLSIAELHGSRACHGAIGPTSVLFDQRGAPVLACFGRARGFGGVGGSEDAGGPESRAAATPAELAAEPRVAADIADLVALAELVLSRVSSPGSARAVSELRDWLRSLDLRPMARRFAEELAGKLFELAPATPVDFAQPIAASIGGFPARMVTAEPSAELHATGERVVVSRSSAAGAAERLLRRIVAALPAVPIIGAHAARVRTALATVRKRFWIAGAAGTVAIVLALSLVQFPDRTDAASVGTASGPTGAGEGSSRSLATPSPAASPQEVPKGIAAHSIRKAIAADDPVAAAEALLESREQCILTRSVLCLDGVDQANSSALDDDGYLIRALRDGGAASGAASLSGAKLVLSERLGDSALVTVQSADSPTADGTALLMVKGEAGWRIRDFLAN